jgi:hypothetical protein
VCTTWSTLLTCCFHHADVLHSIFLPPLVWLFTLVCLDGRSLHLGPNLSRPCPVPSQDAYGGHGGDLSSFPDNSLQPWAVRTPLVRGSSGGASGSEYSAGYGSASAFGGTPYGGPFHTGTQYSVVNLQQHRHILADARCPYVAHGTRCMCR